MLKRELICCIQLICQYYIVELYEQLIEDSFSRVSLKAGAVTLPQEQITVN